MIDTVLIFTGMSSLADRFPTVLRAFLIATIFVAAYIEATLFQKRELGCVTWFTGLAGLTVWIAYPLTFPRILIGAIVLACGMAVATVYSRRKAKTRSQARSSGATPTTWR